MTLLEGAGCLLLSLCCGLDRTALLQMMIARPIVAAPLMGWWLGIPLLGLQAGLALELLFLARLPVGATVPQDDTQMALSTTAIGAFALRRFDVPLEQGLALGLLVALSVGYVGGWLDRWARTINKDLASGAQLASEEGDYRQLTRLHLRGLLHFGGASLATFALTTGAGMLIISLAGGRSLDAVAPIAPALLWLLPLTGVGAFLAQHRGNRYSFYFISGFCALFVWLRMAGG